MANIKYGTGIIDIVCAGCSVVFRAYHRKRFCSQACYFANIGGARNPKFRHGKSVRKDLTCKTCGSSFFRASKSNTRDYCSPACQHKDSSGESNPMFRHGRAANRDLNCKECGKLFVGTGCRLFCSRSCKGSWWQRERFHGPDAEEWRARYSAASKGENNRNWHGGRSKQGYGSGWTDSLRKTILERDGYLCQICGNGLRLHVHHRDLTKTNHAVENLITLCQRCHVRVHHGKLLLD